MSKSKLPLCVILLIAFGSISFSQSSAGPDPSLEKYLDKWSFIKNESYKGASDRDLYDDYVIFIEQSGSQLRIVREFVYNSKPYRRETVVALDGSGETNELADSAGKVRLVRSKTRLRNGVIVKMLNDDDRAEGPADTEVFKVSADGKRLRIERRYRPKAVGPVPKFIQDRIETDLLVLERIS